ncbi:MAG: hypothetical protein KF773_02535 [Deltaproteobacteria bacterium]|nr:hypothetical protein [Deltaproteobacteria bacterium]MCW5801147.1 hypothetical protein [Deltaproteobacteria bacterium]
MSDQSGVWLAMFHRERLPSLDDVAREFRTLKNIDVVKTDQQTLVATVHDALTGNAADITVGLNLESHVVLESDEFASEHAGERPDRDDIARMDARFELVWDLEYSDETYNPLLFMAEILHKMCGAVTFDTLTGQFIFDE